MIITIKGGIPALISVTRYIRARPSRITGWGYGDADPPEDAVIEYQIENPAKPGRVCHWRERIVTAAEREQIERLIERQYL